MCDVSDIASNTRSIRNICIFYILYQTYLQYRYRRSRESSKCMKSNSEIIKVHKYLMEPTAAELEVRRHCWWHAGRRCSAILSAISVFTRVANIKHESICYKNSARPPAQYQQQLRAEKLFKYFQRNLYDPFYFDFPAEQHSTSTHHTTLQPLSINSLSFSDTIKL